MPVGSSISEMHMLAIRLAMRNLCKEYEQKIEAAKAFFGEEKGVHYSSPLSQWLHGTRTPSPEALRILYLKTGNIVFRLSVEEKLRFLRNPNTKMEEDKAWPDLPDDQLKLIEDDIASRKEEVLAVLPVPLIREKKKEKAPIHPPRDKLVSYSGSDNELLQRPSTSNNGVHSDQPEIASKPISRSRPAKTRKEQTKKRSARPIVKGKGQQVGRALPNLHTTHVSDGAVASLFVPLASHGLVLGIQYSLSEMFSLIDQALKAQPHLLKQSQVRAGVSQLISHLFVESSIADVLLQIHQAIAGIAKYAEMSSDDPRRNAASEQLVGPAKQLFRAFTTLEVKYPEDLTKFIDDLRKVTAP